MHLTLKIAVIFCYFHVCALATTNILRLTKGSTLGVWDRACNCPHCGGRITAPMQMPILSYVFLRGKCRYCGAPVPLQGLILECVVFAGMTCITMCARFSVWGVLGSFVYYELVRTAYLLRCGRRTDGFFRQYLRALLTMAVICLLMVFLAALLTV